MKLKYHHCHITGKFRFPSCNNCNLLNRKQLLAPIFFQNGKNYDFHVLARNFPSNSKIKVIPKSAENYISMSWFIDLPIEYQDKNFN